MFEHQLVIVIALIAIIAIIMTLGIDDVLGGILLPAVLGICVFLCVDFITRAFIDLSIVCLIANVIVTLWFWLKYPAIKKYIREIVHADNLNS